MEGRYMYGGEVWRGSGGRYGGDQVEGRYGGDKDIPFGQQCNWLFCIAMPPGMDMVVFISHSGNTQNCVMHVPVQHLVAKGVIVLGLNGKKR